MSITDIVKEAARLEDKVEKEGATERDVFLARELVSRYIDELDRLERTVKVKPRLSADDVAEKVLGYWYE